MSDFNPKGNPGAILLPEVSSFKELLGYLPKIHAHLSEFTDKKREDIARAYSGIVRRAAAKLLRPEWGLTQLPPLHPSAIMDVEVVLSDWLKLAIVVEEMPDVWDLFPLAPNAWENTRIPAYKLLPGQAVESLVVVSDRVLLAGGGHRHERRSYYRPTENDLSILRLAYPSDNPKSPLWLRIKADLIVAGHARDELEKAEVPLVLVWLCKALDSQGPTATAEQVAQSPLSDNDGECRKTIHRDGHKRLTLAEIWAANSDLNQSAKERVRKNLDNRVRKSPSLGGTINLPGGGHENDYDAQLISDVVALERKKHGK
jgi:hypothetical protein